MLPVFTTSSILRLSTTVEYSETSLFDATKPVSWQLSNLGGIATPHFWLFFWNSLHTVFQLAVNCKVVFEHAHPKFQLNTYSLLRGSEVDLDVESFEASAAKLKIVG
jgi:hypothetical protein